MRYENTVTLASGQRLLIRSAGETDAAEVLRTFLKTHGETDYLLTYPEESTMTVAEEAQFLGKLEQDDRSAELVAELDGRIVGTAGISPVHSCVKLRHRADCGIGVEMAYWHLGIGRALMEACLECAARAGFLQMELQVVGENSAAIALYKKLGFRECGRNPWGFRTKEGRWQELVSMRKPLTTEPVENERDELP